jgi:hypothetical protein
VTVIYSKERTSGPLFNLLKLGLNYVEYDANTVFVVVTYHTLVSVRCVGDDNPVLL